uniref:labd-13Z-ene-9,15,16-triol synthase, chloroplastic-like n=1 Tax=Erigeron canadensis TaxID=72917 RepID=UPI001CB98629|nr:labd-13Z-ene-9,15,16-triol synthase, chloroplastic-like [Erigeron canadensis]
MSRLITSQLWSWWWEVMMSNCEITIVVVAISVVALAINLWYKVTVSSSKLPLPPGPLSLPIVGYLPFLGPELQKQLTNMAHTYGPIFKIHLGSKLHVVINTPELAKEVVRDQDETFSNRDLTIAASIISYGGQDIVMSKYNSNWRKLRKIFVHEILSNKNLEACRSLRTDEVRKTIKHVFTNVGTSINISKIAFLTQASVITNMIWDNKSNKAGKGSDLGDELQMVASNVVEVFGKPNLSDFFPSLARFDFQGIERDMKRQINKLDQILTSIIQDRIKSNLERSEDKVGHEGKKDFLQMLLDLNEQKDAASLDITQIKALLVDIMLAGTETTSTLTEWAMAEIIENSNVMKKVQQELAEVVGANNIVEESHLSRLEYLDATIKETFRLHPVLPFLVPHLPSQDCTVGGYNIPNGCTIFLNVWSIHRDPRYWNNPLEFNPDRFLKNKFDYKGKDLKFFPFGSGRRICAGIPVAEKMQTFILASLMHSFDWRLPEGEEHDLTEKFGITLRKRNPLMVIPSQRLHDVRLYN